MKRVWRALPIVLAFFLAGCQAATPAPVPTNTPVPNTPTAEPTESVVQVDYCVSCHTDKEQLISTAKPEEVVEKESSGVG